MGRSTFPGAKPPAGPPKSARSHQRAFFDSFGRDPRDNSFPDGYKNIVENFDSFEYSKFQLQDFSSATCGYFCIHFIYTLSLGLNFKSFLSEYGDNYKSNDISVVEFVNML